MEKDKSMTLAKIIQVNRGLNILTNASIGFKDVELLFDLSIFKADSQKHIEAFQEIIKDLTGTEDEKNKEVEVLLKKTYKLTVPTITLKALKTSEKEIPLMAMDYLAEFITK